MVFSVFQAIFALEQGLQVLSSLFSPNCLGFKLDLLFRENMLVPGAFTWVLNCSCIYTIGRQLKSDFIQLQPFGNETAFYKKQPHNWLWGQLTSTADITLMPSLECTPFVNEEWPQLSRCSRTRRRWRLTY